MELDCTPFKKNEDGLFWEIDNLMSFRYEYEKTFEGDKSFCSICQLDEETLNIKPWLRYRIIKCNHTFHTRCFRHYMMINLDKKNFRCPLCGPLTKLKREGFLKLYRAGKLYSRCVP
jgi:hypothetical protein